MILNEFKCVETDVNLDEYLKLYSHVRNFMEHPEWLGTFEKNEIVDILNNGGKIWLYYDKENPVCSMFYMPVKNKTLRKHNIDFEEELVGALGPIMVSPDYVGNGLQKQMMEVFDKYALSVGKRYLFTKAHSDNVYSINNMLKDGYELVHKYESERGFESAFIKKI